MRPAVPKPDRDDAEEAEREAVRRGSAARTQRDCVRSGYGVLLAVLSVASLRQAQGRLCSFRLRRAGTR